MLEAEFFTLLAKLEQRKCEEQTLEVKSAAGGCPERLYDTFSAFANQDEGGVLLFGLDEAQGFRRVGVYDAQDLQKKLMEVGEAMTPAVRPVLSVFDAEGKVFVTAEIPPLDVAERPCYRTAKGRLKGAYIRVGDADKPMTDYEVYSFEAFRKKLQDDVRPVDELTVAGLDQSRLEHYLLRRKLDRPNLAALPVEQLYELTGVQRGGRVTLSAMLLFSPWPQAFYPQLSIIAARVPGTEPGSVDGEGRRFTDSKRLDGTLPEMLEAAVSFVQRNMRTALRVDPSTGKRSDAPEYPMDAVREILLNALVHRDYSRYTENMPIQLAMFSDRMEVSNPGGLYGRLTLDQLGKVQPDTRNPFLVTAMEALGQTENRYSGIPRIRRAMREAGLPEPVFLDSRKEFRVTLYNGERTAVRTGEPGDEEALLAFCAVPRTRKEITDFLGVSSTTYAMRRYVDPLTTAGRLRLSIPDKPRSRNQTYRAV